MTSSSKKAFRLFLATLTMMSSPAISFAHPGHGDPKTDTTVVHYILSPMHLLPILLVAAIAGGMMIYFRGTLRKTEQVKSVTN